MKIDPAALAALFVGFEWNSFPAKPAGFHCEKMSRGWRNRSPVTASGWHRLALALTGNSDHAGPLYAACGEFATAGSFDAAALTPEQWQKLAKCFGGYIDNPPEKALCRYHYEQRRQAIPSKDEICHMLYNALLACARPAASVPTSGPSRKQPRPPIAKSSGQRKSGRNNLTSATIVVFLIITTHQEGTPP